MQIGYKSTTHVYSLSAISVMGPAGLLVLRKKSSHTTHEYAKTVLVCASTPDTPHGHSFARRYPAGCASPSVAQGTMLAGRMLGIIPLSLGGPQLPQRGL